MPSPRPHPSTAQRVLVYGLLLVLAVVGLWVPLYNRTGPSAFGIPFFYWFQILWIVVGALVTGLAYRVGL
jgi:Protein of unknown function (DUF3311)